ncbi:MAG: hypothetical protein GFH27_549319n56 [Chloroflexi bacterium AL-W]|nr:hypothetical protein [Chloroflexi bacterium AL-N1]NOK70602.1 hypothetical protein [Chloroflexi bacterium AL-N10]NOK77594.1 hypothetical protein [Chloroflexi bacterium AL-N5]NOK84445.1 hypothetical protein [Chloroflexi bacterium AL-W]NOK92334.1 hypothetical protein [Chloroflexi bacterium AL-N15]
MPIIIILALSVVTAYMSSYVDHLKIFTLTNAVIGLFSGCLGIGIVQLLGNANMSGNEAGFALFIGCSFALGLKSLQRDLYLDKD